MSNIVKRLALATAAAALAAPAAAADVRQGDVRRDAKVDVLAQPGKRVQNSSWNGLRPSPFLSERAPRT